MPSPKRPTGVSRRQLEQAARRARTLAARATQEFFDDDCAQRAAAISYYALLSLFPLAILLTATFGLIVDDDAARERVITFVLDNVPLQRDAGATQLSDLLRSVTADGRGFGIAAVAGLLLSASAVMGAVRRALNAAFDVHDARPPLQGKLIDLLLVLAAGLTIMISLTLTFTVRLVASVGEGFGSAGGLARAAILLGGQLVPALLLFVLFVLLYGLLPATATAVRDAWPGALVATLGVEACKAGFAIYLQTIADYGAIYASLGSLVALLVFVFITATVFLLGAEVASEWPAVRDGPAITPRSGGEPWRRRIARSLRGLAVRPDAHRADGDANADAAGPDDTHSPNPPPQNP